MRTDQFDFLLPEEKIALRPCSPRDFAKLLIVNPVEEVFLDKKVKDLPTFLKSGDALVFNNTKVIPASLTAIRFRGDLAAKVDFNLIKHLEGSQWRAFARPAKKLKPDDVLCFINPKTKLPSSSCQAKVCKIFSDGEVEISFNNSFEDLRNALSEIGQMPLPPYIALKRTPDELDVDDYQTIFATCSGAVASPTASLHFTPALLTALKHQGVSINFITLHVGAGTFLPVKTEDTEQHKIHSEWAHVSKETAQNLNATRREGGRIIAVGTTVLRTLETSTHEDGTFNEWSGDTSLFIQPGYRFKSADILMTNFHLPKSTLFMLVCAFSGLKKMQCAYSYAIKNNYRFYSYGDACLLYPPRDTF